MAMHQRRPAPSGIQPYISQILEAEATPARGDHIVEEMRPEARERPKAGSKRMDRDHGGAHALNRCGGSRFWLQFRR
jgi:hypothetical protein